MLETASAQDASSFVYGSPIRLYDIQEERLVGRKDFLGYINENADASTSQSFDQNTVARYAIASHRWDRQELAFVDREDLKSMEMKKQTAYAKFKGLCKAAEASGCRFVWIDTLCIDNTNAPELDESIRSMFSWYRNAYVCIVYLGQSDDESDIAKDTWFSRGWTLQELLAPKRIQFYSRDWNKLGMINRCSNEAYKESSPNDESNPESDPKLHGEDLGSESQLLKNISRVSYVSLEHLIKPLSPCPELAPVAFRYISIRETTRPEDISYCLLGLLDVQMPIAYGEGSERAFYRLQLACAQSSSDRALFDWRGEPSRWNSMLACSPKVFKASRSIVQGVGFGDEEVLAHENLDEDDSFTFTNSGLRIMMWIFPVTLTATAYLREYTCSIASSDDTAVRGHGLEGLQQQSSRVFVGIFGYNKETVYAVLLQRGTGSSARGYKRLTYVQFLKIPGFSTIQKK
ncbi:hypothetical protein ONZ45_g4467 [Pleurotus djamor]|nr:hypothetical protein ONZ45_g4467 [Pleurotus djamor]